MVMALLSQMSLQSLYSIKITPHIKYSKETTQQRQTSVLLALYMARFPIFL